MTAMDHIRGYRSGAVDYISVPVVPEVLRAKVSVFAELYRKNRQLQELNRELERRVAERSEELRLLNGQLQERIAELESIMRVLPVGVAIAHDAQCERITGNAALSETLGMKLGDNISKSSGAKYEVYANGTKLTRDELPVQRAAHTQRPTGMIELEIRNEDRPPAFLIASALPLFDEQGAVRGAVGAFFDVTERKHLEETLKRSDRLAAMGKVAGIVAHEINNPLEAIMNTFYLLKGHPSLNEEARYYVQLADQELERISHITRQTLSFYRESQSAVNVPVSDLLDDVLELQDRLLQTHKISIEKRYSTKGYVQGFPVELKQVFLNLAGNAIQAMPNGGRLRATVAPVMQKNGKRGVQISISDTGCGIQRHDARHLFEPFFTTKSTKGTGLGLWISRGIIHKHDGSLKFRSVFTSSGASTCFQVFLPISELNDL
jgi:signal transduction histidine kinase